MKDEPVPCFLHDRQVKEHGPFAFISTGSPLLMAVITPSLDVRSIWQHYTSKSVEAIRGYTITTDLEGEAVPGWGFQRAMRRGYR
jgi:hypothetical protein